MGFKLYNFLLIIIGGSEVMVRSYLTLVHQHGIVNEESFWAYLRVDGIRHLSPTTDYCS